MAFWYVNPEVRALPFLLQVYLAKWHETQVAVKVLLNTGVKLEDMDGAAGAALSLSQPELRNLQLVR